MWRIERFSKDTAYPIRPEKLIVDVRNTLAENDVVISDIGAHKLWLAKVHNTYSLIHVLSRRLKLSHDKDYYYDIQSL